MKSHTARLYVFAATLAVFFVLWAVIAARPWTSSAAATRSEVDPRLTALNRWERRLTREAALVRRAVDRRWSTYRRRLRVREQTIAAAKRRHAQELAAAAAATARIAALQTGSAPVAPAPRTVTTTAVTRVRSAPTPTPPPVKVVTLPPAGAPATTSTSSVP